VTVRVLVVDDHPVFRDGLAASLAALPDIEVAGVAADGPEAVEMASTGVADVVLMDLNLPSMSGVEATARTCAASSDARDGSYPQSSLRGKARPR